jgi:hypothetical protein
MDPPKTLSVPEAGRWLGIGRNASYEAARRGDWKAAPSAGRGAGTEIRGKRKELT